jgi:hypothetical protein
VTFELQPSSERTLIVHDVDRTAQVGGGRERLSQRMLRARRQLITDGTSRRVREQ